MKKRCDKCRKKFTPKTDWQVYCSKACREAAFRSKALRKPKTYTFS